MKQWFKILAGKTDSTPAEIAGEIDNLKEEQAGVKAKLLDAKEALAQARVELMGGAKKQADIDPLADAVRDLEAQADTLSRAISDLTAKHGEAVERERQAQVKVIDGKISELKDWMTQARQEYVKARVVCDAYEKLLAAPLMSVGMQSREALMISGKERAAYQADAEAITQGHGSIMGEIMELQRQREQLLKGAN